MRTRGVPPWEVAAQLGHSGGKEYAITERYAFYSPDYLSGAVKAQDGLIRSVIVGPDSGQSSENLVPQEGFEPPTHALRMPSTHFLG
jgi:hypothetical protein